MIQGNYLEQDFEEHIEEHLLQSEYRKGLPEEYDRELCLIPDEVLTFIKASQPKEYEKLERQYGADTPKKLCDRLTKEIRDKGALKVLRKGVQDRGAKFSLAYFKPTSGMNPEHLELYKKNRLIVIRQLKYSLRNENSIDMVIFLNGIPIITMELKNSLTGQFVENAIKQYKNDRDPREPLLHFKRCLVHFAVGNEKAYMTTRLQAGSTKFLPFNKDTENPINENGHKTAYLWEDILPPDTLLDLIKNYLHIQVNKEKYYDKDQGKVIEKEYEVFIFPRYHQLDVVRKLISGAKSEGVGNSYLVQHSAGSGKSNSIAWLSHQLTSLYQTDDATERLFDSIIVVTDRKILDKQLQDTIKQFEQTTGVVVPIDVNSQQLKESLEAGKDIIITTLQKFPVISASITELKGKRFAVIIDEAHSSQSGESAAHLNRALTATLETAETEDSENFYDLEERIIEEIKDRGKQKHISYFAFTATPKNKTLEMFGRKDEQGVFCSYHTYSMRQAIEEGFILDILDNYTTFKRYFKLMKKVEEDEEFSKKKSIRILTSYVDLQAHTIENKVRIMLDHFLGKTVNAIQGRGRAMVVTRSRLHAVKFYLMFKKIMGQENLLFRPLVAFSGTVRDPDSGIEYTENSCNNLGARVSIQDAFKTPEYRILVVANKFQTGFDEPLFHTMYVDKKLGGVGAVQTLSRLNRTMKGKTETFILDFVNEAEDIQKAFQSYYQKVILEEETDPNKLYDIKNKLEDCGVYTKENIEEYAAVFFNASEPAEKLQPILDRSVHTWENMANEQDREDFRGTLQYYIRLYGFLSQIITFTDSGLEKLFVFAKGLNRKLPKRKVCLPFEVQEAVDLDSFRIDKTFEGSIPLRKEDAAVTGYSNGSTKQAEDEKDYLSNIVETLNTVYGINLTEDDRVDIGKIQEKLEANKELQDVVNNKSNTPDNIRIKFEKIVDDLILEFVHNKLELYKKLTKPDVNKTFKSQWYGGYKKKVKID